MLSIPLTWPVGQGVKTSPSHGENTSSILVLAARNFRSDSEVFCCLNIFLRPRYNNRNSGKRSGKVERVDYRNDILSTTIYLWLISLTASKELSILLLKLYNDGAIGISNTFLDSASVIKTDNQLLIRSVRFMQVESP